MSFNWEPYYACGLVISYRVPLAHQVRLAQMVYQDELESQEET